MSINTARNKKIAAAALVAGLVLGGGGAAFAYWTSTGTGTGTATTGVSTDFVIASSAATGGPLTPGGPDQSIAFTVTNPSSGVQALASVVVTVDPAWSSGTCDADDFVVDAPVITYGNVAPAGVVNGMVAIRMINDPLVNQDDCQDVDVDLIFDAN